MQIGSRLRDVDVEHIVADVENHSSREELASCQHFLHYSELEQARHGILNYAIESLNLKTMSENLEYFFNNLRCGA